MLNARYICSECGREYAIEPGRYLCDDCRAGQKSDEPLRGILEVRLEGDLPSDWAAIRDRSGTGSGGPGSSSGALSADPRGLLPIETGFFPPIPVGGTPLWEPIRYREETGYPGVFLKDDTANPTGSLKDRASYLVAAFAAQHGMPDIVVASTGNAGSSMAGVAAAAGRNVRLYLPATAPQAKIVQAMQYGADVIKVVGTYDDAFDASMAYVNEHGGLSRNTAHNPLTIEGKKTAALEIFLQLGGKVPEYVFVPTGDGVIMSGVYKGFEDLVTLGLAERMPTVYCVQAEGSCALSRALKTGSFGAPVASSTIADSISVDIPRGGYFALGRLQRHNGRSVVVSDDEILKAQLAVSRSGLFCEPAAAAAAAGFAKVKGELEPDGIAVVLLTGSGLKDIAAAMKGVEM